MTNPRQNPPADVFWQKLLVIVAGVFLALCLLKFGNPVIFEEKILAPQDIYEFLYSAWPIQWGYVAFGLLFAAAIPAVTWKRPSAPLWIFAALFLWISWQFVSATHTVDSRLTSATLRHFSVCVGCFFVGFWALSGVADKKWLWIGLLAGFLIMLKAGFEQHFGGLERTRRYFELYVAPKMTNVPPEYLGKITSTRIFGTLFYPNSLAGAILLALPVLMVFLGTIIPSRLRRLATIILAAVSLAALFWSGSKAGWLLFVLMTTLWVLHLQISSRIKLYIVVVLVAGGVAGFGLKYSGFFKKGATSVVARTDYWRAALQIVKESPIFGSGPGTFMIPYARLKAPDAEMTRLCHNDYLQQASDSGIIGFLAYLLFVGGTLFFLYRHISLKNDGNSQKTSESTLNFALWLGLFTLALHSFAEFHLYIAGLAWPFFLLLGLLCGSGNPIDKTKPVAKVAAQ